MDENMKYAKIHVWLPVLMYCAFASLINSGITYFPFIPASLTTWISRGIMLTVTICMFQLAPVHDRYQKAGIFRAIMLACNLITSFLVGSALLTLAASIVSIIAVYQEYCAHAEVIADQNVKLSKAWHSLFNWSILAAVLLSLGATIVAVILVMADIDGGASRISAIAIGLLSIPQCVIEVLYIWYIKKMFSIFSEGEVG
jgi:hypothetical protein